MSDKLKQQWWKWHKENPHVWKLFEKYTMQAIHAGHNHYSSMAIIERIRWHSDVETTGDKFKINNNHKTYYSRYFHHMHPEHDGFFRLRETK
jgi:hypothetical protein